METKIINFKKLEVTGATKEEALAKAPFQIIGDATQAFKNWKKKQVDGITDAKIKEFALDYIQKKAKSAAGVGFSITVDAAVADTRERPYKINDVKNEKGKRKYVTTYELVDSVTGEVVGMTQETKAVAKEMAKELYKNGFKHPITCKYTKQVLDGEPIAFTAEYTPSKSSKVGTYMVFGVEA